MDGAISISVLQWLCNADTSSPTSSPYSRLTRFFTTLHACLANGARAVFQFYPQNDDQIQLIMNVALKAGFTGGLVVDYPNSKKAKKYYLYVLPIDQTTTHALRRRRCMLMTPSRPSHNIDVSSLVEMVGTGRNRRKSQQV